MSHLVAIQSNFKNESSTFLYSCWKIYLGCQPLPFVTLHWYIWHVAFWIAFIFTPLWWWIHNTLFFYGFFPTTEINILSRLWIVVMTNILSTIVLTYSIIQYVVCTLIHFTFIVLRIVMWITRKPHAAIKSCGSSFHKITLESLLSFEVKLTQWLSPLLGDFSNNLCYYLRNSLFSRIMILQSTLLHVIITFITQTFSSVPCKDGNHIWGFLRTRMEVWQKLGVT